MYLSFAQIESLFAQLPPPPRDTGRLVAIVRRNAPDVHESVPRAMLSADEGLPGDTWGRDPRRRPDTQLTVMRRDIAELLGNGQTVATAGDNLIVDLDLSAGNLPVGSRLRVGTVLLEVTPEPHTGCSKFKQRFGGDALRFVNSPEGRAHNLRGIYWKVIEAGEVAAGSSIQVLSRPGRQS